MKRAKVRNNFPIKKIEYIINKVIYRIAFAVRHYGLAIPHYHKIVVANNAFSPKLIPVCYTPQKRLTFKARIIKRDIPSLRTLPVVIAQETSDTSVQKSGVRTSAQASGRSSRLSVAAPLRKTTKIIT